MDLNGIDKNDFNYSVEKFRIITIEFYCKYFN